ncbi:hypothetical protein AGMMS49944_17920 [Spirochaetia bacterium]|nr:hypothetical protein AGMMS49944_17920 [Spirochaetia bacterium]
MSIRKKNDAATAFAGLALMLAAVLAGLAACQDQGFEPFPVGTPTTGVGTGDTTGGDHGLPKTPRLEIYWDNNENVNQAGKELTWLYDDFATLHPASSRLIGGKILNAPTGFDYLEWTISPASAVTAGIVSLPSVFANRLTTVVPNGSSFEIYAGAVPGNARISVRNTKRSGGSDDYGPFYADFDIRVGGGELRPLTVYVTETIRASNLGLVKVDNTAPPPTWSVRSGNAAVSLVAQKPHNGAGYDSAILDITGIYPGSTTYFGRGLQGGTMVDTEGPLIVEASTTWYVGPGATGKYGFRNSDKITWDTCLLNMRAYYGSTVYKWPGKGRTLWEEQPQEDLDTPPPPPVWRDDEKHGVIRLTGDETGGGLAFDDRYYPWYIDLVNDSPETGQKILGGPVRVLRNRTLSLTGIKTTGTMAIEDSSAQVTMLPSDHPYYQTEINGSLTVKGLLTMQDGSLTSPTAQVLNGGKLTITTGQVRGGTVQVETGGLLTMNGGTFTNTKTDVRGGSFIMNGGTFATHLMEVQRGGVFTMNNGTLSARHTYDDETFIETKTDVKAGGTLTVNAGSVNGKVDVSGVFTMNGGTFNSQMVDVKTGGTLTIQRGTTISPESRVYKNGILLSASEWPPAVFPYFLVL